MAVDNLDIANHLAKLADLLEIRGANPFRIRAYRQAARVVFALDKSIAQMLKNNEDITHIRGIGKAIASKIKIIVKTGKLPYINYVNENYPHTLSELTRIEGLGPKRIKILNEELNIYTIEELKNALQSDDLEKFSRIGMKLIYKIRENLAHYDPTQRIIRFSFAKMFAKSLFNYLKNIPDVEKIELTGSLRRFKDSVGNLNFLVSSQNSVFVINEFLRYDDIIEIMSSSMTHATVRMKSGLEVDLRVVLPKHFYTALIYYTGSKSHIKKIQQIAKNKHYRFDEKGLFQNDTIVRVDEEKHFYQLLDLPYIEPELREDQGEFTAIRNNSLPKLISVSDIRGDMHCHTNETDGINTLEEMIRAAVNRSYEYIAITDHSKRLAMVNGLDKKRLFAQIKEIEQLQKKYPQITILKGIEVDILEDGQLDFTDDVLQELDFTVCSIHHKFRLDIKKQTERILRAMDNPYFTILGHPTGRLINRRDPYELHMEKIMQKARENNCYLEINAQPERLDLNADYCRMAKEYNVKLVISTDAHSIYQLNYMEFGITQARRGWIEKQDVINTYPLNKLKLFLRH